MRYECLNIAKEFHPECVEDLIQDASKIYSWLEGNEYDDKEDCGGLSDEELSCLKIEKPSNDVSLGLALPITQSGPITCPNQILNLIRLFWERDKYEPRPKDLIEAGVCSNRIYKVIKVLEDNNKITRIRLSGCKTVLRLKEAA